MPAENLKLGVYRTWYQLKTVRADERRLRQNGPTYTPSWQSYSCGTLDEMNTFKEQHKEIYKFLWVELPDEEMDNVIDDD